MLGLPSHVMVIYGCWSLMYHVAACVDSVVAAIVDVNISHLA